MKKLLKYSIIPCLLMMSFFSCEDEDKDPLFQYDEFVQGAYFRTVNNEGIINRTDIAGSSYTITGELVSAGNGTDVSNIQVLVEFVDRTTDDDEDTPDDNSIDKVVVNTNDISAFTTNANGFPETTFNVTIPDALAALGLDIGLIEGGDEFFFWIQINMADGRVYDVDNLSPFVAAELAFASPLFYRSQVICVLPAPPSGNWTLSLVDNYGDGWQGSQVVATIDGVGTPYFLPDFWGSTNVGGDPQTPPYQFADHVVNVPSGTSTLTFSYVAGDFPSECEFKVFAPSGNLVAVGGPSPLAGEIVLNLCNE